MTEAAEVPQAHALALVEVAAGHIVYDRTALPWTSAEARLERIVEPHRFDLLVVEFGSQADASQFVPLLWFGREVTGVSEFEHSALALGGSPKDVEEVSGAALDALLDSMEGRHR